MINQLYHDKVIRYLNLSRQYQKNVHVCPNMNAMYLAISPDSKSPRALSSSAGIITCITGAHTRISVRVNRRSKESFLAGSAVTLRNRKVYTVLSCIQHFAFYNSANFRGLVGYPKETGVSYKWGHVEFFVGSNRAFNGNLTGFGDENSVSFISFAFSQQEYALFFLRGLRLPAYP